MTPPVTSKPGFRTAGIMGWPVSHSRSPLLHGHWLAQYQLPGAYIPLPVAPDALAQALPGLSDVIYTPLETPLLAAALRAATPPPTAWVCC